MKHETARGKRGETAEGYYGKTAGGTAHVFCFQERILHRFGQRFLRATIGRLVRWIWVHEIEGLEYLPREGAMIVASNHESYMDFLVFTAISPRNIYYLAAEKFFESKLWRWLMYATGQIPVDRKSAKKDAVHDVVLSLLRQGKIFGIFPEGTRSADGSLQKAFLGVAKFALRAQAPIIPVGFVGSYEVWPRHKRFPRFFKKIKVKIGAPLYFDHHYHEAADEVVHRKVTDEVMHKIAALTGEIYLHAEPDRTDSGGSVKN